MRSKKVIVIGSFTEDLIEGERKVGGPLYYSAQTLHKLGYNVIALGATPNNINMPYKVISLCSEIPKFQIKYLDSLGIVREIKLINKGCIINEVPLDLLKNSAVLVNPVINEVPLDVIKEIRKVSKLLAIDLQGFVREAKSNGSIVLKWSKHVDEVVSISDVVHADVAEVPMAKNNPLVAAEIVRKLGAKIAAITMGAEGSIIAYGNHTFKLNSLNEEGEATGTGDIYTAVLVSKIFEGLNPLEAGIIATVVAGLKVRYSGFNFPLEIIKNEIKKIKIKTI